MIHKQLLDDLKKISPEEQKFLEGSHTIQREIYMGADSSTIDAKKLLDTGRLISIRPHTRFVHFPEHSHNYVEVVYMCSGTTTHIINGRSLTLQTGDLLFLGQGVRQEILPAGENDIAVNFIILPIFFDKPLEMLGGEETPLRKFLADSLRNENANYLYFQASQLLPVQNLMENLIWTLKNNVSVYRRTICQTTMGLVFLHLMSHTDKLLVQSKEDAAMVKLLTYVEEHYADGTLTEICAQLHYDLPWFSREIKRQTGKTFKELLQEKRLTQAGYLLKHSHLHIDEIGQTVGYSNLSYFHRIFRQKYGVTPKKYRDGSVSFE